MKKAELLTETTPIQKSWALVHPKKKSKRGYKHSGEIIMDAVEVKREYSFLEYIQVCRVCYTLSLFKVEFQHHAVLVSTTVEPLFLFNFN